ncbi:hypothetical protein FOFC_07512, partial [Fusarium oxysporum]
MASSSIPRQQSHPTLPPAKLQELERLSLYYNLPEAAIIYTKCSFTLSPKRTSEHPGKKYGIARSARHGLKPLLSSLNLPDPDTLVPRPNGSRRHPYLTVQQGCSCKHCGLHSASWKVLEGHLRAEHRDKLELTAGKNNRQHWLRDHIQQGILFQSWTANNTRRSWLVSTGNDFNSGSIPSSICLGKETPASSALQTNWLRRTGWKTAFRDAHRDILFHLTELPYGTANQALPLGVEGEAIFSLACAELPKGRYGGRGAALGATQGSLHPSGFSPVSPDSWALFFLTYTSKPHTLDAVVVDPGRDVRMNLLLTGSRITVMDGLGIVANIAAVLDLSAKVATLCFQYSTTVASARGDIKRLQSHVSGLAVALRAGKQLVEGPNSRPLVASRELAASLQLEGIITNLERHEKTILLGLQIDQTNLLLRISERIEGMALKATHDMSIARKPNFVICSYEQLLQPAVNLVVPQQPVILPGYIPIAIHPPNEVDVVLESLQKQEDTDKDMQITIEDNGPKLLDEERKRLGLQSTSIELPAGGVIAPSQALLTNWMRRTGWERTFERADCLMLISLSALPTTTLSGTANYLGIHNGQKLSSPAADEYRVSSITTALDRLFDQCEEEDEDSELEDEVMSGFSEYASTASEASETENLSDEESDPGSQRAGASSPQVSGEDRNYTTTRISNSRETYNSCDRSVDAVLRFCYQMATEDFEDGMSSSTLLVYFSAVRGLSSQEGNGYLRPARYTPILSRLIYCTRLIFLEAILPRRAHPHAGFAARPRYGQLAALNAIRVNHMCDGTLSPLGEFFSLLAYGMSLQRSEGPAYHFDWSEDGQTISWDGNIQLSMGQFRGLAHEIFRQATIQCQRLMYGFEPEDPDIGGLRDRLSKTTPGYSFLTDPQNRLEELYLTVFMRACTAPVDGLLKTQQRDSGSSWDIDAAQAYLYGHDACLKTIM